MGQMIQSPCDYFHNDCKKCTANCPDGFNLDTYEAFRNSDACRYMDCLECEYVFQCDEWVE